jgi:hypothetical protein
MAESIEAIDSEITWDSLDDLIEKCAERLGFTAEQLFGDSAVGCHDDSADG